MDYSVSEERLRVLHDHFYEFSFEGREPDRAVFEAITNPVEYHVIAGNYNWDDGPQVLNWIVNSPLCDKGTALLIFWQAQPDYYTEFLSVEEADYDAKVYQLLRAIITNWENNRYQTALISYNPRTDPIAPDVDGHNPKAKWEIPAYLKQPVVGELEILFE